MDIKGALTLELERRFPLSQREISDTADFIILDRKRILNPIIKNMENHKDENSVCVCRSCVAGREALRLAGLNE